MTEIWVPRPHLIGRTDGGDALGRRLPRARKHESGGHHAD
jgi:hypothetical protein